MIKATEFCGFSFIRNEAGFPTIELRIMDTVTFRKLMDEILPEFDKADELIEAIEYTQRKLAEISNELEDRYGVI